MKCLNSKFFSWCILVVMVGLANVCFLLSANFDYGVPAVRPLLITSFTPYLILIFVDPLRRAEEHRWERMNAEEELDWMISRPLNWAIQAQKLKNCEAETKRWRTVTLESFDDFAKSELAAIKRSRRFRWPTVTTKRKKQTAGVASKT